MKNEFTPSERRMAAAILRARKAQFIGIDYVDAKGDRTTRTLQVRVNVQAAHEKRGGFTGAGSWLTHARHLGEGLEIAITPDGRPCLRALCHLRGFMRCFRLDRIEAVRGLKNC